MQFSDLKLLPPLMRAVEEMGYQAPSPIQEQAIPPVLAGRDLLGCAQTGTGKTAAFALPILQNLMAALPTGGSARAAKSKRPIRVLVLTPTRELALQIQESFEAYGKHLPLRSTVIFGGVGQGPQVDALRRGVDILVATPGRLNDLIGQGHIKLDGLTVFVLDEADRMLDMGFVHDVKKVIKVIPQKRQTLLFSATMPKEIVALADSLLHDPAKVFVTPPSTTVEMIEQSVYLVDKGNKKHLLASLLRGSDVTSTLVFTRTKHGADRVVRELSREGIKAMAIHGNKSQGARQEALARLKDGRVKVLVATDIAARGLDINELSHVFNYDLPNIPETYVHRIGRTGRAGRDGVAVSFCCAEELPYLADIQKLIGFAVPQVEGHAWPMQEGTPPPAPAAKQPARAAKAPAGKDASGKAAKAAPAEARKPRNARGGQQPAAGAAKAAPPAGEAPRAAQAQPKAQKAPRKGQRGRGPQPVLDTYENRPAGSTIVYKRPTWGDAPSSGAAQTGTAPAGATHTEGDEAMSRNNRRRRGRSGGGQQAAGQQSPAVEARKKAPAIPKNEKGIFDFSEAELAEDDSLKLISGPVQKAVDEPKYANFEDYLKDHEGGI